MVTCQPQHETKQDQKTESGPGKCPAVLPPASRSPYKPLSQHTDCTRLVRIEAAKTDHDPIICSLFEVEFREKPKFHALSYMWGEGPAQCNIILNGVAFDVRQNLEAALRYLRAHAAADTCYWIDAICINQDDILERTRQVRIMHHIYFRADTVVVWLGKRYAEYEASLLDLRELRPPESGSSADRPPSDLSAARQPNEEAQQRKLAGELYNDGYWNRVWIIQEIWHAHNIKVCFGNSAMGWDTFIHFITMHNIGSDGPVRLSRQRQGKYTGSGTLLQLLQDHREALCQDSKDKVYGLVGLASDASGFVIDYQKSTFEIWTDVMEFMNRHSLFADEDIVKVGGLVKSLLMGTNCLPLQQILRQYAPGKGDNMIITDPNHFKAFELQAVMLGCVICAGPRPHEMVGSLSQVEKWMEHVQSNYKGDLGQARQESDMLVRTILDLDDSTLSKTCFECRSVIQWPIDDYEYKAWRRKTSWTSILQSRSSDQPDSENISAEQPSSDNSRLFQMLSRYTGHTPCKMGLASSNICSGDLICSLRWPRRAVVVRAQQQQQSDFWRLQVVGTAVVTKDLGESSLRSPQPVGWPEKKLKLAVYVDATTIFTLLA